MNEERFDPLGDWIPEEREEFITQLRAAHHVLTAALLCAAVDPNDVSVDLGSVVAAEHLRDAHALAVRSCKRFLARHQRG